MPRQSLWLLFFPCFLFCSGAQSQCPKLRSGRCWIDCVIPHLHQILCEDVDYHVLHDDLKAYDEGLDGASANVSLAIWNSPFLHTVETNALHHLENHLVHLTLQNLDNMLFLPMLREFPRLTELQIMDCPLVKELDLTILPASLEKITLFRTGIGRLENRVDQAFQLPALTHFSLQENLVTYIQKDFFKSFPILQDVSMSENYFDLSTVDPSFFATVKPQSLIYFTSNRFAATMSADLTALFFYGLVNSTFDQKASILNLGYNTGMTISQAAVDAIGQRFRNLTQLHLRFSQFQSSVSTASMFQALTEVSYVDVRYTNFPVRNGAFGRAIKVKTLLLDGNSFGDQLNQVDIFFGLESASIGVLSLANNKLRKLPENTGFSSIRGRLEELDLSDNELQLTGLSFRAFSNLKKLSLRNNRFTSLSSSSLGFQENSRLEYLDISCNELEQINAAVFDALPPSLIQLNMTFCPSVPYNEESAPKVVPNAFSNLRGVNKLSIANGFLGISILSELDKLPNKDNKELVVDNNGIRELNPGLFSSLRLTVLHLRNNQIQTLLPVGANFDSQGFSGLQKLDLSSNQISALQSHDLVGLRNLTTLFLEKNNLTHVADGIFDNLPKLTDVYLQDNLLNSVRHLFRHTGEQLKRLSIERNKIHKISKGDLARLTNLDLLYLHGNPTEVIEEGAFDGLQEKVAIGLPSHNLTCDCRNAWLGNYIKDRNFHNFFGARFEDPANPFGSIVITHVPKCVYPHGHMNFVTEQICSDPGTTGTTAAPGKTSAGTTPQQNLFFTVVLTGLSLFALSLFEQYDTDGNKNFFACIRSK